METRYSLKPRLFRQPLIVLQVRETVLANYDPSDPRDWGQCARKVHRWRDATLADLSSITPTPEQPAQEGL